MTTTSDTRVLACSANNTVVYSNDSETMTTRLARAFYVPDTLCGAWDAFNWCVEAQERPAYGCEVVLAGAPTDGGDRVYVWMPIWGLALVWMCTALVLANNALLSPLRCEECVVEKSECVQIGHLGTA